MNYLVEFKTGISNFYALSFDSVNAVIFNDRLAQLTVTNTSNNLKAVWHINTEGVTDKLTITQNDETIYLLELKEESEEDEYVEVPFDLLAFFFSPLGLVFIGIIVIWIIILVVIKKKRNKS